MLPMVLLALQLATTAPPACVDPATSLRRLATAHVSPEQLAAAGSERMAAAFRAYLASGSRTDYRAALVRYEATGTGRYDHAARALVLGIIYASGPDLNPEGSAGYRHRLIEHDAKAANLAARHLNEAAVLDSAAWLPPVALAHLALAGREPQALEDAFHAFRRTLRQPVSPIAARTALADLLIATDSAASAAVLLDGHTGQCPGAEAALAEALLLMGDTARGVPLLLGALARSPADQLDRFLEDVAILLGPEERAALASVPVDGRAQWLREFWERSAAASARSVAQRLSEHARRTALAHRVYRLQTIRTTAGGVAPLEALAAAAALPWDARGIVHVRHGVPDTVIRTLAGQQIYLPMNETWVYARATPPWLVHFGRSKGPDWFLIEPWVGCGPGGGGVSALDEPRSAPGGNPRGPPQPAQAGARARAAARASGAPGALFAREYYLARARIDERYSQLAAHCAALATHPRPPEAIASHVAMLARDYGDVVSGLVSTESARRRLERPLRLLAGAYAFRDAAGRPELATFAWVPASDVSQLDADAELDLSFALLGTTGAPLRVDTTALVRNGFERDGGVLRMAVHWPSPPPGAEARLHVFVGDARDPERGGYADQRVVAIPAGVQAISSVVVAVPGEVGPLVRGEHRVAPQPGHVVTVGDKLRLFFELYGMDRDAVLETTIRIRRTREEDLEGLLARYSGKRAERELRFREPAGLDGRGVVVRDVDIAGDLVPGDYAIDVIVRAPLGELRASTALRIREP